MYVIIGLEETYVGSSINIAARLASHVGPVANLLGSEGTVIQYFPVELVAAEDIALSRGGLLRTVEQGFIELVAQENPEKLSLNKIRARALKKFDNFVKSFCK